jgi:hypothetical protein
MSGARLIVTILMGKAWELPWARAQSLPEDQEGTMQNKQPDKLPLFEKILAGSCVAALGSSMASESIFTMSILAVTGLGIVSLFLEVWR